MAVADTWDRLVTWTRDHAPITAGTLNAPPPASWVRHGLPYFERSTTPIVSPGAGPPPPAWPSEIRTWMSIQNGTDRSPAAYLLPNAWPLGPSQAMSFFNMIDEVTENLGFTYEQRAARFDDPPGTPAGMYLPTYIPIGEDLNGNALVVDTREGQRQGCVLLYDDVEADADGVLWESIDDLLLDVLSALDKGTSTKSGLRATVADGSVQWT